MSPTDRFNGFSPQAEEFFRALAQNNNKPWFEEHRKQYDELILRPAKALVAELGPPMAQMVPGIHAEPMVNKSIFKIFRDTRFARDKSPFKDHLGLWLWEGQGPRMECSGFYLHFEPGRLMLGAGIYGFAKAQIEQYRIDVLHHQRGPALERALAQVAARGGVVDGQKLKRPPRGVDPDHPRAALARYTGLWVGLDEPLPDAARSAALVDYCLERWSGMLPLHFWLAEMAERALAGA